MSFVWDWGRFCAITRDRPPCRPLVRAAALVSRNGRALDLGAGGGRDTRYLLEQNFHVTAVDADPHAVALLSALPKPYAARLRIIQSTFKDFAFEVAAYDLISAQFALPFMPRSHFDDVFTQLKVALAPGGVFTGQFFGVHDQWNIPACSMTFLTRSEADAFVSDLRTIEFSEQDDDGHTADGSPKHWHVFHILACKP